MGLLYKIAKWSVNKLIKKGVDLTNLVETDEHTQKVRGVAQRLNDDMVMLQNDFSIKRAEIIELQTQLIQTIEPVYITMLAESKDSMVQTTMTKHWVDKLDEINYAIIEHETMVSDFNKKHEQLRILESKL
jgi:hypothetical protein